MQGHEFNQRHLNQVSRSFAFCIERLEEPLRSWIGCSYLLCRVVDTIEDSEWNHRRDQDLEFDRFQEALAGRPVLLSNWSSSFPEGLTPGEKELLDEAAPLFAQFHSFPKEVIRAIRPAVFEMSEGMRHFCHRRVNGVLRVASLEELNEYCFYVAGLVGEVLTRLIFVVDPRLSSQRSELLPLSHRFGGFLQKVNILKDQRTDEKEGRFFVVQREDVFSTLTDDARAALDYVLRLPTSLNSYRLFCSWSLFLGLASLPFIQNEFREGILRKLPREKATELYDQLSSLMDEPEALKNLFEQLLTGTLPSSDFLNELSEVGCPP